MKKFTPCTTNLQQYLPIRPISCQASTVHSPLEEEPIRDEPMESISSMNMIEGACSLAITNNSLTIRDPSKGKRRERQRKSNEETSNLSINILLKLQINNCFATSYHFLPLSFPNKQTISTNSPSPMYFWTSSEPDTLMKVHSVWWATALASRVFPVPGGPYNSTPYDRDRQARI